MMLTDGHRASWPIQVNDVGQVVLNLKTLRCDSLEHWVMSSLEFMRRHNEWQLC